MRFFQKEKDDFGKNSVKNPQFLASSVWAIASTGFEYWRSLCSVCV